MEMLAEQQRVPAPFWKIARLGIIRLRLAANLFRNGHQMLEDDCGPIRISSPRISSICRGPRSRQLQRPRREGLARRSNDRDLEHLDAGRVGLRG